MRLPVAVASKAGSGLGSLPCEARSFILSVATRTSSSCSCGGGGSRVFTRDTWAIIYLNIKSHKRTSDLFEVFLCNLIFGAGEKVLRTKDILLGDQHEDVHVLPHTGASFTRTFETTAALWGGFVGVASSSWRLKCSINSSSSTSSSPSRSIRAIILSV